MQMLSEIFSSTGDQARLVTTLIAAIIAVLVLLGNQYFNSRRSKKSKLIEKIEEMYSASIKLHGLRISIHNEIVTYFPKAERDEMLENMHEEFLNEMGRARMLSGLYFPELGNIVEELTMGYDSLYKNYLEAENLAEYLASSKEYLFKIDRQFLNINTELGNIMKKSMH